MTDSAVRRALGKKNRARARKLWEAAGGICGICWDPVSKWNISTDHVIPRSKGGSNGKANLQPTHKVCNVEKGDSIEVTEAILVQIEARRRVTPKRLADLRAGIPYAPPTKPPEPPAAHGRVCIDVVGMEFDVGGNTIWVHGKHGTVLRIKTVGGRILADECKTSSGSHGDVMTTGDIKICIGKDDAASEGTP